MATTLVSSGPSISLHITHEKAFMLSNGEERRRRRLRIPQSCCRSGAHRPLSTSEAELHRDQAIGLVGTRVTCPELWQLPSVVPKRGWGVDQMASDIMASPLHPPRKTWRSGDNDAGSHASASLASIGMNNTLVHTPT